MSCSKNNLRNLDTTVYNASCGCERDDNNLTIYFADRHCPYYPYPPFTPPFAPENPPAMAPSFPPMTSPTEDFAVFTSNTTADVTYTAGASIPFAVTSLNTSNENIINNNGVAALTGGRRGRTYLVNYQLTGTFNDATIGLSVNGVNEASTSNTVTGEGTITTNGSFIVNVPANSSTNVALNVIAGTVTGVTPTGSNFTIIRIA